MLVEAIDASRGRIFRRRGGAGMRTSGDGLRGERKDRWWWDGVTAGTGAVFGRAAGPPAPV